MPHVPPHLLDLVVEQDYGQYDEQDHAVWRFVVMQTHARLRSAAHPAYAAGFDAAGIQVERIAHIATMSERLAELGWGAVCVDGFIPPRAFQAFQAASVLPIAADIRSSKHLTYTPAPDIIHEAAGHAPFLADAGYARFLRRIGDVGRRAFSSPFDRELYEAIRTLSEVKEEPSSTPAQVAQAEQAVERLQQQAPTPSEATKVARLYWWTVEYGLVGSLARPRLYGAGLLSSIGEGHFCLGSEVRKLPLTAQCVEVGYDITRAQPQLFVAEDFEQLDQVLEAVAATLGQRTGGLSGLQAARQSGELATLTLDSGMQVVGRVSSVEAQGDLPSLVRLSGPCTWVDVDRALSASPRSDGLLLLLGTHEAGIAACSEPLLRAPGARVVAVEAGAPDGYESATVPSGLRVPRPRSFDAAQREVLGLYDRALAAFRTLGGAELEAACATVVARLDAAYPDEWLLRFNVLESLVRAGEGALLRGKLEADLERLELRFGGREPIATGLAYVRALSRHTPSAPNGDWRPNA